ncbi:MAG TPA: tRNA pseudouridine(38-40) synthase TruA, partial [Ruminococcaceae bacterium]|nr:tRNA pseudouridine(38-40) synthase TruA [Oscillospiraceae bacterium]
MRNLLLVIRYDGARYHGWQVQQNAVTVQQVFQDAL